MFGSSQRKCTIEYILFSFSSKWRHCFKKSTGAVIRNEKILKFGVLTDYGTRSKLTFNFKFINKEIQIKNYEIESPKQNFLYYVKNKF